MDVWCSHERTNEELRRLVGVEPIATVIRSGRLIWYGHVMRKSEEDLVRKCMLLFTLGLSSSQSRLPSSIFSFFILLL